MPLLVLQATRSVAAMGLVTATATGARLAAGAAAGVIVDRVDRRRLMIVCDLGRAAVFAAIPLGWWLSGPSLGLLYAVTAIGAALGMFFQVAYVAAVPGIVERDRLTDANSRLHVSYAVAGVLGPMLAGLLSGSLGPAVAVGVDALSFLVSALSLAAIHIRQPSPAAAPATAPRRGALSELVDGARFLWRQPVLRWVSVLLVAQGLALGGTNDLFVFKLKHDLARDDGAVGVFFGAGSAGAIVGGLLVAGLRRRVGFGACFLGGNLVEALAVVALGAASSLGGMAALVGVTSLAGSVRGVASMSLRQQITPDQLIGRVTAVFWMVVAGLVPLGAAVSTRLAARFGTDRVIVALGVLAAAAALGGFATPARRREPTRPPSSPIPRRPEEGGPHPARPGVASRP